MAFYVKHQHTRMRKGPQHKTASLLQTVLEFFAVFYMDFSVISGVSARMVLFWYHGNESKCKHVNYVAFYLKLFMVLVTIQ